MHSHTGRNSIVKSVLFISLFGLTVYLAVSCEEEKSKERSYPRVKTYPVTNISSSGATFNADIYSLGSEPILEHGFTWAKFATPDINYDDRVLLGPSSGGGVYKADVVSALAKDVEYYVRSFVKTGEHVVYGTAVKFTSLGSGAPLITGFSPDSAAWLDTIKITGKNFTADLGSNVVRLNETECKVVEGTDTTLLVLVSSKVSSVDNAVSVDITGNRFNYTGKNFRLLRPVITGYTPVKAAWEDTLTLKGRHFKTYFASTDNKVKFGSFEGKVLTVTDTTVKVRVPSALNIKLSSLSVTLSSIVATAGSQFELLPPYFTFTPKNGTWGTVITLSGKFNGLPARNSISLDYGTESTPVLQSDIVTSSLWAITFRIPIELSQPKTRITYKSDPFTIAAIDTFRLNPPVITSFTPATGIPGSLVTIRGKYFKYFDWSDPEVLFGSTRAYINEVTDTTIKVTVPAGLPNSVKITVNQRLQSTTSAASFTVVNPSITSVSPLSAGCGAEVTINGLNFDSPTVTFGSYTAEIVSATSTRIVVKVPVCCIDSVPVPVGVQTGISNLSYSSNFQLAPPVITSVSPSGNIAPGSTVTITGTAFNPQPENTRLYWDTYPLEVQSASQTQIVATLPYGLPRQTSRIRIQSGGYRRYSTQTLTVNSQWLKLSSPLIRTSFEWSYWVGLKVHAGVINNLGYLISEGEGITYQYNPTGNSWTTLAAASPFDGQVYDQMADAVNGNKLFLIGGHNNAMMKAFDPSDGQWHSYVTPVQQSGIAFSLLNKLYFGLDYWVSYAGNPQFYESDPANGYSWINKGDFPVQNPNAPSGSFTIGDYGYVVLYDNSVYRFNPSNLQWTRMADFPGFRRVMAFSFVLNGKAYFGGGRTEDWGQTPYSDIWIYDPVANSWSGILYVPGARYSAAAFTIGSKAYVGFGMGVSYDSGILPNMYDFYEFDPNYPAK